MQRRLIRALFASPRVVHVLGKNRHEPVDDRVLDPHVAALLALDDLIGNSDLGNTSPSSARLLLAEQVLSVDEAAPSGVRTRDVTFPAPGGRRAARVYVPSGIESPSSAVAYFHGGGFVTGGIASHDALCARLAVIARTRVISVDYRLAPEHPFPAAVEDGVAALRWIFEHANELGVDPARVGMAGDSAGGNLSAVVSLELRNDALRPKLAVLLYPVTDATCSFPSHATLGRGYFLTRANIEWYIEKYVQAHDRAHPKISPLFAEDLRDLPRTLIYSAGFDPLRDEAQAYANALEKAGNSVVYEELERLVHGFVMMGGAIPAAREATRLIFERIGDELR